MSISTHQHGWDIYGKPILYSVAPADCTLCLKERIAALETENRRVYVLIELGRDLVRLTNPLIEQDANDIQAARIRWKSADSPSAWTRSR